MAERQTKEEISSIVFDKLKNLNAFETTYNSSYGRFYPEEFKLSNYNLSCCKKDFSNYLTNIENNNYKKNENLENFLKRGEEESNKDKAKLMCPNCINKNIIKAKSLNRIRREKVYETDYFEDKMRDIHENKRKNDIKNREYRAKKTYKSLFRNRERSAQPYKKITSKYNNNIFGESIEYGMLRCRKRELRNDQKLFGLNSSEKKEKNFNNITQISNNLINNKSWISPRNYLLDKNEYSFIITKQIESYNLKSKKEKLEKIKEENNLLNEQLKKERNELSKEICFKNKERNEINKINCNMLKAKKFEEYRKKKIKRQEKENINLVSKKQLEDVKRKLRQKKRKNINVDKVNLKMFENKILKYKKHKNILNRNYEGLIFKGMEKKNCENCNRSYPKNVLSYMYYTYNDKQKNIQNKI